MTRFRLGAALAAVVVSIGLVIFLGLRGASDAANHPVAPDTAPPPDLVLTTATAPVKAPGDPVELGDPVHFAATVVGLRDDWLYATLEDVDASSDAVFSAGARDRLHREVFVEGIGPMRHALATAPSQAATWYMTVPLTAGVIDETPAETTVEVWEMQIFSREGVSEPTASWSLHTLTLEPVEQVEQPGPGGHSWQVRAWSIEPGPAPGLDGRQQRTEAVVLNAELMEHGRLYRDAMLATTDGTD